MTDEETPPLPDDRQDVERARDREDARRDFACTLCAASLLLGVSQCVGCGRPIIWTTEEDDHADDTR